MNKFKVGDTVRNVKPIGGNNFGEKYGLAEGNIRTVTKAAYGCVQVDGATRENSWFDEKRFELVPSAPAPKFKVGDTVRNVKPTSGDDFGEKYGLARDGVYTIEVIDIEPGGYGQVKLKGVRPPPGCFGFWDWRFELVPPASEPKDVLDAALESRPTRVKTTAELEAALGLEPGDIAKESVYQNLGEKRAALLKAGKILAKAGLTVERDRLESIAKGIEIGRTVLK